ncbi:acetoin reductase family protein [Schizopora paradoxa]|uniref:Acetoin reductase family protein n=1 Tax=Schizopora paradoxa TaxID=27342 RepID=A0A0H2RMU2_9AGAM|nr:acetoin reductase family protein [Schizopora paradoxa]
MASPTSDPSRVAIITGAAGDIGKVIATRLASDGFAVALSDLPNRSTELNALVTEIVATGAKAIAVTGDVTVEKDVETMVETTVKNLGSLDVMVANAAVFKGVFLDQMDTETWDKIFAVNTRGMMFCYKWAAKQMIKQGKGGKLIGAPLCAAYCASKFAVRGLTQVAAIEYARFGITANAYAPGFIEGTQLWKELQDTAEAEMGLPEGAFKTQIASNMIKLGRLGTTTDIAGLVSFFASKDSDYITGQTFSSDGGMHMS